jgi:hypothetical protein
MICMKKNGSWDDVSLKSTMESVEICSKIQTTSQTWVCLSHHYGVICIALHNLEKRQSKGLTKRSGVGTSWVHENDASNQALDHLHTIALEGGWNYTKKLDTFQEWNSKVGMAKVVQETRSWLLTKSLQRGFAYTSANRLMVNAFDHSTWMRMIEHVIMHQCNKWQTPKLLHLPMQLCDTSLSDLLLHLLAP